MTLITSASTLAQVVHWKGDIDVMGNKLGLIVTVKSASEATISVPAQGVENAALKDVKIDDASMAFVLQIPPMTDATKASFALTIDQAAGTATGDMTQSGMKLPVTLKRATDGEPVGPNRPQDKLLDPTQYTSEDVTFVNPKSKGTLAGTLTLPKPAFAREGKHAAVVLISGSGTQDRDCLLLGHRSFRLYADTFSRAGVAVLRVDDPGAGKSENPYAKNGTSADFVTDVAAAVAYLRTRPDIDPARVGLLGHSEGGLIAPLVAAEGSSITFIALLAGPGVSGRQVLEAQFKAIALASGQPEEEVTKNAAIQSKILNILVSDAGTDDAIKQINEALTQAGITDESERQQWLSGGITSNWMRWFLRYDPRPTLAKLKQPILIANGELDTQVLPTQNVPEIEKALISAGNTHTTTIVAPKLNHLFQPATTGSPNEYATIETTVDPAFLEQLTAWIVEHAKPGKAE